MVLKILLLVSLATQHLHEYSKGDIPRQILEQLLDSHSHWHLSHCNSLVRVEQVIHILIHPRELLRQLYEEKCV